MPGTYKEEGISAYRMARELILRSNWGEVKFPIHWCTLLVPLQGHTLTVERSTIRTLVTNLAFSVSIGWQHIVSIVPPYCAGLIKYKIEYLKYFGARRKARHSAPLSKIKRRKKPTGQTWKLILAARTKKRKTQG